MGLKFFCVTVTPDHPACPEVGTHTKHLLAVVYLSLCWIPGWGSLTALLCFQMLRPHPDLGWDEAHQSTDQVVCQT